MIKKGFTLAEVLITLTIIGVVAALTIPFLRSGVEKTTLENQIHSNYTQLENAANVYMAKRGEENFDAEKFATEYLKIKQKCASYNSSGCFATSYYVKHGEAYTSTNLSSSDNKFYLLTNGASIAISKDNEPNIYLDVNGADKPNVYGQDFWVLKLFSDGVIDDPNFSSTYERKTTDKTSTMKSNCNSNTASDGCLGVMIRNGFKFED